MIRNIAPLLAPLLLLAACGSKEEEPAKPVVEVKVAKVEQADVEATVRAPAVVFAREQANIAAKLTSPVRELLVKKGDSVEAGHVLARLENGDLQAQRAEATASVADAQATLEKMSAGTLPSDIERGRGQVLTAEAALTQAQKFYERRKQLYDQGAIPNRDLVVSQTELAQAKANYDVAVRALQLLEGQSKERDLQIARSRLEQAKSRLAFVEAQIAYSEIRSPFAGTITEQFMFPGDMAKPDVPIFTLADLSVVVARAQVPEADAVTVRRGQPCSLAPSDRQEPHAGRVTVVNQAVDPARRTVEVWCEIANGKQELRAGVFGTLTIGTGVVKKAVVAPAPAVQFEEGMRKGFVMVVGDDHKASKREIEAGVSEGGRVVILKGLKPGEAVIVEAGYGLPDGTQVKLAEEKPADKRGGDKKE